MALTPAEKQKAYRERQKQKQRDELKSGSLGVTEASSRSFSETFQNNPDATDFELALGLAGIVAPQFDDERGPLDHALPHTIDGVDDPFGDAANAIGRAEVMVGCLVDAAVTLAGVVNTHLKREINDRLSELENSEQTDRATAMQEAVKLHKMLDQLDKQVRWTFPQWKVTGT